MPLTDIDRAPAAPGARETGPRAAVRKDRIALAAAGLLVLAAVLVGNLAQAAGVPIHAPAAPLFAFWGPHVGWGTPLAVLAAVVGVRFLPGWFERWSWGWVLVGSGVATLVWTTTLALSRGWSGITEPLTPSDEYLVDVPRVGDLHQFLLTFNDFISGQSADPWSTHVAGGPPLMLMVFAGLARIGLSGPVPAAVLCLLGAAVTTPLVAETARRLGGDGAARRMLPFAVLLPGAIWAGVSADALIAAAGAAGLLLLVVSTDRAGGRAAAWAFAGGLTLGIACLLSYGAGLLAVPAFVLLVQRRRFALLVPGAAGALAVAGGFALAGWWWWSGYQELLGRYADGYGSTRPYWYWLWADAACLVFAIGPAVVVGLRRTFAEPSALAFRALLGAMLVALAVASVTGLSKAEVERIWLPWAVWLPLATAALPRRSVRWWLTAQVVLALLVEHLLLTPW